MFTANRSGNGSKLVVLVVAALLCMGMGGIGDREIITKIPKPERLFTVNLVDAEDVSFHLQQFSMEGLTLLPVTVGKADVSLDFAEILEARFQLLGERIQAEVAFRNGERQVFYLAPDLSFFGLTEWGKLKLEARDIRLITFKEQVRLPLAED